MPIKAYYLNTKDGYFPSVVLSENADKAKYAFYRGSNENGYKYKFSDMKCHRLATHDILANPMPCTRTFPINRPIILEDATLMMSKGCGCFKCSLPNPTDQRAGAPPAPMNPVVGQGEI